MGLPWAQSRVGGGTERSWWGAPASNLRPAARTPPSGESGEPPGTARSTGRREAWRLRRQNKWEVTRHHFFLPVPQLCSHDTWGERTENQQASSYKYVSSVAT